MITSQKQSKGFTIVELLIVIVVIAILAAISIVVYNGMRQRAVTTAYTGAVEQWYKFLKAEIALSGSLPATTGLSPSNYFCLGSSVDNFPPTSDFQAGECFKSTLPTSVMYSSTYFDSYQLKSSLSNGLLPTTSYFYSAVNRSYTTRGVILNVTAYAYQLLWIPQMSGQCGKGISATGEAAGLLTGDYCVITQLNS